MRDDDSTILKEDRYLCECSDSSSVCYMNVSKQNIFLMW